MISHGGAPTFLTDTLNHGLQLIAQPMPGLESVAVAFAVVTGARDEHRGEMGVSHYLEHMMFKGTERRSAEDIAREFNEIGADFNAFTSSEWTVYYARVLNEYFPKAVDLLTDMLRPKLDAADYERERQVILEEIARAEDSATHVLWDEAMLAYFGDHPLGHRVLGNRDTIGALSVDQMRGYWGRRYVPNNIVMALAGKIDWDLVRGLAGEKTQLWPAAPAPRIAAPFTPETRVIVKQRPEFQQEHFAIAFPSVGMQDPDLYAAHLLVTILGDVTGSRLFWSIYQEGLAENVSAALVDFDQTGLILTYANAEPAIAPKTLAVMRDELKQLERHGVKQDELDRAKTKLLTSVVMNGESSDRRMFSLVTGWLSRGKLETLDEQVEAIKAVTTADVARVLERFPPSRNFVLVGVGPMDESALVGA